MDDKHAIILFALLAVLMTMPMASSMANIGGADAYQFTWVMWSVGEAVMSGGNFYHTAHMLHPEGMSLMFLSLSLVNSIPSIPLQVVFGPEFAFNFMIILSFFLSGVGMYMLAKHLTKDSRAAFVAGLVFAFAPTRMAHAFGGHINILTTQFMPLFALYFIRTLEERRLRNPALCALFWVLSALGTWLYLVYMGLVGAFILLWNRKMVDRRAIKRLVVLAAVFLTLVMPFAYPLIGGFSQAGYMTKQIDAAVIESADLVGFFVPAESHPLFGGIATPVYDTFTGNAYEHTVFIGYTVLALALFALLYTERKKVSLWLAGAACAFVLALGPVLHVMGRFAFPMRTGLGDIAASIGLKASGLGLEIMNSFIGLPLPYLLLHMFMPFFSVSRSPARFSILLMLCLAVVAAFAVVAILKRVKKKRQALVVIVISALILLEFLAVPLPSVDVAVSPFYERMAMDSEDYAIVEIPIGTSVTYWYYQTIHQKPTVNGGGSRSNPNEYAFIQGNALLLNLQGQGVSERVFSRTLGEVLHSNPELGPIFAQYGETPTEALPAPKETDFKALGDAGVRYLIVHRDLMSEGEHVRITGLLGELPLVYMDEVLEVYRIS